MRLNNVKRGDTFLFALGALDNGPFVRDPTIVRWSLHLNGRLHAKADNPARDPGTDAYRVQLDDDVDFRWIDNAVAVFELDRTAGADLRVFSCINAKSEYKRRKNGTWKDVMPSG